MMTVNTYLKKNPDTYSENDDKFKSILQRMKLLYNVLMYIDSWSLS